MQNTMLINWNPDYIALTLFCVILVVEFTCSRIKVKRWLKIIRVMLWVIAINYMAMVLILLILCLFT